MGLSAGRSITGTPSEHGQGALRCLGYMPDGGAVIALGFKEANGLCFDPVFLFHLL